MHHFSGRADLQNFVFCLSLDAQINSLWKISKTFLCHWVSYLKENENCKLECLLLILCTQRVTLRVFSTKDGPLRDTHAHDVTSHESKLSALADLGLQCEWGLRGTRNKIICIRWHPLQFGCWCVMYKGSRSGSEDLHISVKCILIPL